MHLITLFTKNSVTDYTLFCYLLSKNFSLTQLTNTRIFFRIDTISLRTLSFSWKKYRNNISLCTRQSQPTSPTIFTTTRNFATLPPNLLLWENYLSRNSLKLLQEKTFLNRNPALEFSLKYFEIKSFLQENRVLKLGKYPFVLWTPKIRRSVLFGIRYVFGCFLTVYLPTDLLYFQLFSTFSKSPYLSSSYCLFLQVFLLYLKSKNMCLLMFK